MTRLVFLSRAILLGAGLLARLALAAELTNTPLNSLDGG